MVSQKKETNEDRRRFTSGDERVFELTGGSLCLDFANTVDNRPTDEPKELLVTYADWVAWSRQSGIFESKTAEGLVRYGKRHPSEARDALDRAIGLREALYEIFSSAAAERPAPDAALAVLNQALPDALAHPRLEVSGGRYDLRWRQRLDALESMLSPVVRSAVELLASEEISRVRVCAAGNCSWLFLDRSRSRTRQWCDMKVCGNRAKARRHYQRSKRSSA